MTTKFTLKEYNQLKQINTEFDSDAVVRFIGHIHTLIKTYNDMQFEELLVCARVFAEMER
ncbi:MAG: hypothetical protein HKN83_08280 [Gammaproteobacteria bacterium]|nr:hypothetical protein [Gammaproteobacteria bacterium]